MPKDTSMTKDQDGGQNPRINRGMELMLRNNKQRKEGLFTFSMNKAISFFSKEIHLKIELSITKKIQEKTQNV